MQKETNPAGMALSGCSQEEMWSLSCCQHQRVVASSHLKIPSHHLAFYCYVLHPGMVTRLPRLYRKNTEVQKLRMANNGNINGSQNIFPRKLLEKFVHRIDRLSMKGNNDITLFQLRP